MTSLCAPLCATRSWWNSWWKCRLSYPILPCGGLWSSKSTFQFLVVVGEVLVFKVFFPDRLQQRRPPRNAFLSELWSRSFVFLVKAFKIFVQDRFRQRLRLFTLLLVQTMTLIEPGDGVFRTFPHGKKVRSAGQVSADLPRHVSSWTPAAYKQSRGSHEQVVEMEKKDAEYKRRMIVLNQRVADGLPIGPKEYEAWRRWSGLPPSSSYSSGKRREEEEEEQEEALQVLFWCADTALCAQVPLSLFFFALCSLSTAPCIWQSLVRCSPWFDSGYMLCQFTAAFVALLYYVAIITPVIHFCMGSLACGELCSFGPRFSGHPRSVRVGAVLGQGCVLARCWATTGPHGPDSAVTRGVPTGAILGIGC